MKMTNYRLLKTAVIADLEVKIARGSSSEDTAKHLQTINVLKDKVGF